MTKKSVTKVWRGGVGFARAFFCLIFSLAAVYSRLSCEHSIYFSKMHLNRHITYWPCGVPIIFPSFRYSTALFRREVQIGGNLSRSLVRHKNIDCEVEFEAWFIFFLRLCIGPRDEIPMQLNKYLFYRFLAPQCEKEIERNVFLLFFFFFFR